MFNSFTFLPWRRKKILFKKMDIIYKKYGTHARRPSLLTLLCCLTLLIFTSSTSVFEYFENICIESIECTESGEKTELDKENKLDDYIQSKFEGEYFFIFPLMIAYSFSSNSRQIFTEISTPPPEQAS